MTAAVKQACAPTPFDWAWGAAQYAGWPAEAAFVACCTMRACEMTDREIELAFLDAAKRIQ